MNLLLNKCEYCGHDTLGWTLKSTSCGDCKVALCHEDVREVLIIND